MRLWIDTAALGTAGQAVQAKVGEMKARVNQQVLSRGTRAVNQLRNAELEVLRGKGSGRIYRKYPYKSTYQASAPGEPPARRTGNLRLHWTGNVKDDNQEMKFALLQQSIIGDVQLMPNMNGTTNKEVELNVEMNAYPVIYYDNESIKRDNKWVIKEKGTYTVTVNVETMKVEVKKLDVVYLVGSVLSVEEGENQNNGYDLKRAPYFTKIDNDKYELIINLHEGDFKILSKIEYTNNNNDYYAPEANSSFLIGSNMDVDCRQESGKDYKWQVTVDQTGAYKLTLNTSDLENVTLTAERIIISNN